MVGGDEQDKRRRISCKHCDGDMEEGMCILVCIWDFKHRVTNAHSHCKYGHRCHMKHTRDAVGQYVKYEDTSRSKKIIARIVEINQDFQTMMISVRADRTFGTDEYVPVKEMEAYIIDLDENFTFVTRNG